MTCMTCKSLMLMKHILLFVFFFLPIITFAQKIKVIPTTASKLIDITKENQYTLIYFGATWCHPCVQKLPEILQLSKKHPNVKFLTVLDPSSSDQNIQKVFENIQYNDSIIYRLDGQVYKYRINKNIKIFTREICPMCFKEIKDDLRLSAFYLFNKKGEMLFYNKQYEDISEVADALKICN
jgi:thiol-disulfide isomerase/thioredoxin